jgi:hypothetical protein
MVTVKSQYAIDLAERVFWTFLAGFFGAVSLDITQITDLGWVAWVTSGVGAGVISLLKGLAAKAIGNSDSASLTKSVGPKAVVADNEDVGYPGFSDGG